MLGFFFFFFSPSKSILNNVSERAERLKDPLFMTFIDFTPEATKPTLAISSFDQNEWSPQKQM